MFFRRYLESSLTGALSRNKVRLLLGARQTGKTVLLRHVLTPVPTHVVNLQDTTVRRRLEADPGAFGREIRALPRTIRTVLVDEIQKVPALLDEVHALYDAAPTRWQFYLTGSSARRLRTHSANLLPGRSHLYHLYPVCSWESEEPTSREIGPPSARAGASRAAAPRAAAPPFPAFALKRTLLQGSLPGVRAEPSASARATLDAYVDHYLEEEIRREALVRDMGPFVAFVRLAAAESGRQVNLARLSQESGVPASTLKTFYQVLVDTFVGYWMPTYARRTRKRLLTTPRFYYFDLGVRNAAAELPLDAPLADEHAGPLLEHWVALELIARAGYLGRGYRVSFWRTAYGVEVDFVWETPHEALPIEVKWTAHPRPSDARHLETFLDEFPGRARRGILVCRCAQPQQLTERVRAVSWDTL